MADTCIVCLGELASGTDPPWTDLKPPEPVASSAEPCEASPANKDRISPTKNARETSERIAHLLPCSHNLHNDCLKPWVERANSCPICRQSFNMVELKNSLTGPCLTSYTVQDKRQVADIDPSMVVDDDIFEESVVEPCLLCEGFGDSDLLLLCDGCSGSCHTYCAGLETVPAGSWFCQFCVQDGTAQTGGFTSGRLQRARVQQGRPRHRMDQSQDAWARVWQSVWDNLNIDLDFPFDDETERNRRTPAQRREMREWRLRFQVAESQGGAARFRDTAATLLEGRGALSRVSTPSPESQEELRAWNAFDKARELESTANNGIYVRNKRKSVTASPVEPLVEPERRLKRPRTRLQQDNDKPSDVNVEADSVGRSKDTSALKSSITARGPNDLENGGPSFFQSLLKEVETTPKGTEVGDSGANLLRILPSAFVDPSSPCSSSVASPAPSNAPSPRVRSTSPPPFRVPRPSSPPLTSQIQPIFAQQTQYSPVSPSSKPASSSDESSSEAPSSEKRSIRNGSRQGKTGEKRHDSSELEQIRSTKAAIQQMVSIALKPAYHKSEIDKDQYTAINRAISRMLYEKVGEDGGLVNGLEKEKWQSLATREVDSAVKKLKQSEIRAAA